MSVLSLGAISGTCLFNWVSPVFEVSSVVIFPTETQRPVLSFTLLLGFAPTARATVTTPCSLDVVSLSPDLLMVCLSFSDSTSRITRSAPDSLLPWLPEGTAWQADANGGWCACDLAVPHSGEGFNKAAILCNSGRSWRRALNVLRVVKEGGRGGIAGARVRGAWLVADGVALIGSAAVVPLSFLALCRPIGVFPLFGFLFPWWSPILLFSFGNCKSDSAFWRFLCLPWSPLVWFSNMPSLASRCIFDWEMLLEGNWVLPGSWLAWLCCFLVASPACSFCSSTAAVFSSDTEDSAVVVTFVCDEAGLVEVFWMALRTVGMSMLKAWG